MRPGRLLVPTLALLVVTSGCYTSAPPDLVEPSGKEVTIFVHGIKGSFLVDERGERAWLSAGDLLSSGDRSLAVPPGGDDRFGPLRPDGPLTRFTIFPLIASADVYLPWLEFGARKLPGFTPFSYDWRLDAHEAVLGLAKRIDELAERRGGELRVNLVGHSLGGLIALTYVRYGGGDHAKGITWAGAKHVKRLALVGAPFGGSPSFLEDILRGDKNGRNEKLLAAEAMASFVTSYELLPAGSFFVSGTTASNTNGLMLDALQPGAWEFVPETRRPTPAMLEKARAFREALRETPDAPKPPAGLQVLVVAGVGRSTIGAVSVPLLDQGIAAADFERSPRVDGDSRVPTDSCIPPRPLDYKMFKTKADHVNLLNDEEVQEAIRAFIARP